MPRRRWGRRGRSLGGCLVWPPEWGEGGRGRGKQGGSDRVYVCLHTCPSTHTQDTIQSPPALNCLSNPAGRASFLPPGVRSRTIPHRDQLLMRPSKSVCPSEGWGSPQGGGKLLTLTTSHPSFIPASSTEMSSEQPKWPRRESPSVFRSKRSQLAYPGRGPLRGFRGAGGWGMAQVELSFLYPLSHGLSVFPEKVKEGRMSPGTLDPGAGGGCCWVRANLSSPFRV